MEKKFIHRENKELHVDGQIYYHSRSVAVVGVHLAQSNGERYVLVEKRSNKMDCPGKWCVPCGYLDWDETTYNAVMRETYEETGFYVPEQTDLVYNNNEEPIKVNSIPSRDARQNVTLIYLFVYEFKNGLSNEVTLFESPEVDEVMWLNINNLDAGYFSKSDVWAFHHDDVINGAIGKYNETFH